MNSGLAVQPAARATLRDELMAVGLTSREVDTLVERYDEERIRRQLRALPYRSTRSGKSRPQILIDAVTLNLRPPKAAEGFDEPWSTMYPGPNRYAKTWQETEREITEYLRGQGCSVVQIGIEERDRRAHVAFEKEVVRRYRCPDACVGGCDRCTRYVMRPYVSPRRVSEQQGGGIIYERRQNRRRRPIAGSQVGWFEYPRGRSRIYIEFPLPNEEAERNAAFRAVFHYVKAKCEALEFEVSEHEMKSSSAGPTQAADALGEQQTQHALAGSPS